MDSVLLQGNSEYCHDFARHSASKWVTPVLHKIGYGKIIVVIFRKVLQPSRCTICMDRSLGTSGPFSMKTSRDNFCPTELQSKSVASRICNCLSKFSTTRLLVFISLRKAKFVTLGWRNYASHGSRPNRLIWMEIDWNSERHSAMVRTVYGTFDRIDRVGRSYLEWL